MGSQPARHSVADPEQAVQHRLVQHVHRQRSAPDGAQRLQGGGGLSPARMPEPCQKHPAPEQKHPRQQRKVISGGEPRQVRQAEPEKVGPVQPRRQGTEPQTLKPDKSPCGS